MFCKGYHTEVMNHIINGSGKDGYCDWITLWKIRKLRLAKTTGVSISILMPYILFLTEMQ